MLPRNAREDEVGAGSGELGAPADRSGGDPAAGRNGFERRADERVTRIATFGDGGEHEAVGGDRRQIFRGVNREIGVSVQHGLLHLFHEYAGAADRVQVGALVAVAGGGDEHVLDRLAQQCADAFGLPAGEGAGARRDPEHELVL